MEENKMVLHLMQNVCDKLDALIGNSNIIKADQLDSETFADFIELQGRLVTNHNALDENQKTMNAHMINIAENMVKLANNPNVINQKREYYLFGKDTPFSSKLLLYVVACIFIASSSFKYIPGYLNEKSAIKIERDNYKLFYQYAFLDAYAKKETRSKDLISILKSIEQKDTVLLNYIYKLSTHYNTQIKKEALEQQLENLEKAK